jgi:Cu(I)/Ag(I) efflux system protein CusF
MLKPHVTPILEAERRSEMKHLLFATALVVAAPLALAQPGDMKGMDMKDMDEKGMKSDKKAQGEVHNGTGVVTNVDRTGRKITLKHAPIKSLNWPTMTMAFGVKDEAMLDKVAKGKKVEFEFVKQGQQFLITSIK